MTRTPITGFASLTPPDLPVLAYDLHTGDPIVGRSLREAAQRMYGPRANPRITATRGRSTLVGIVVSDSYGRRVEAEWVVS